MIPLNKKEVLRYLGFKRQQELTGDIDQLVEEMMVEVQEVANPRYYYQIYPVAVDHQEPAIKVVGTQLSLTGKAIYRHLQHAEKIALLGVTLGIEVEQRIRQYEVTDLTRSLILDSCCTEYIEKITDLAECDIEAQVKEAGLTLNRRFSPGYGDLPLATQKPFLATINGSLNLGINLTPNYLMIPRKSVTAVIGLFADKDQALPKRNSSFCRDCDYTACDFRVGGRK